MTQSAIVPELPHPDQHHLQAAQGWLELGNPVEANAELEKLTPSLRAHPDVLELRWHIYAHAKNWDACVDIADAVVKLDPDRTDGWIHRSFALHVLKRTQEAFDQLFPVADKFPTVWTVPYNLACYCAQMGKLNECQKWFKKAVEIDAKAVKLAAIDDPDLEPAWGSLARFLD